MLVNAWRFLLDCDDGDVVFAPSPPSKVDELLTTLLRLLVCIVKAKENNEEEEEEEGEEEKKVEVNTSEFSEHKQTARGA